MLGKLPDAVGHALRNQRAGAQKIAIHKLGLQTGRAALQITSLAFAEGEPLPQLYTADGAGLSPPLQWSQVPAEAVSLVLLVEDADAPTPEPLVHAIVVGLDARRNSLPEGALDSPHHTGLGLKAGRNSFLKHAWLPPDPPPGHGRHRYAFQLFALGREAAWGESPGRGEVIKALMSGAIAAGCLVGTYERDPRAKADRVEDAVAAD